METGQITEPQGTPAENSAVQTVNTALGGETPPVSTEPAPAADVPESYDFSNVLQEMGGELDEKTTGEFSELLKGMGASQEQAAQMAQYGLTYAQGVAQQMAETLQQQYVQEVTGWGETAKKELGGAYEETLGRAASVRDYIEQKAPGFKEMLNLTGCGNHVAMIKAMAAMADLITEDNGKANGGSAASGGTLYPNTDFSKY